MTTSAVFPSKLVDINSVTFLWFPTWRTQPVNEIALKERPTSMSVSRKVPSQYLTLVLLFINTKLNNSSRTPTLVFAKLHAKE